ncbi:MAG TPA: hypothetical protein VJU83_11075 [Burkholderiales bacterium]|nr:hypothetical protein [Burkholderiales bacterium]
MRALLINGNLSACPFQVTTLKLQIVDQAGELSPAGSVGWGRVSFYRSSLLCAVAFTEQLHNAFAPQQVNERGCSEGGVH